VSVKERELQKARELGFFERYLTIWVLLCMIAGIGLGYLFPGARDVINSWQIAQASIPVDHGAALATVVGVLIEVPVMLLLVRICLNTNHWFEDSSYEERI